MRRSFDGLSMLAEHIIRCNPLSGHLPVFRNKRSDRLKILYWHRDGWVIRYTRLEADTFQFPFAQAGRRKIAACEPGMLLERIDLSNHLTTMPTPPAPPPRRPPQNAAQTPPPTPPETVPVPP
jgi:transposase